MNRVRIFRTGLTVALLIAVLASVLGLTGLAALREALSSLLLSSFLAVVALLGCGMLLSSLRLKLITADLGYSLTFREAVATLSVSQLAGTVFFQFAGQLLARGAMFSQQGIPAAAVLVISGYERVVALSVSLALAGCGALYLFGTLSFDLQTGGISLIKLAFGLAAAVVGGALLAWGSTVRRLLGSLTRVSLLHLLRSFVISAAIQFTTLGAYVAIGSTLAPEIGVIPLAAASCVIMLAASLPISLGGWGLREMSAVVALQAIGLSSAAALLVAVLIGLLSLATVGATALLLAVSGARAATAPTQSDAARAPDYGAALDWALPVAAATAVFFQIHLPTASGQLNVNLADPVVLIAAALFVLRHIGKAWPQWRVPHVNLFAGLTTGVIALSFVRGWVDFGWTDWAFANKTLGWLILLCYGMAGALIVRRAAEDGFGMLLATFVAAGATLALLDVSAWTLVKMGASSLHGLVGHQVSGFSQNPNAFGFCLLLVVAAALALGDRGRVGAALVSIALAGIWYTGSRAAIGTAAIMLALAPLVGIGVRRIAVSVAGAAAIFTAVAGLGLLAAFVRSGFGGAAQASLIGAVARDTAGSNLEHLRTVVDGLALFLENPLFGAGLGAFTQHHLAETGTALVIHSTPVWLLAETGLVGFLIFAAASMKIVGSELRRTGDMAARFLLLSFVAFASMSMVHELLYQRAFWLLWGAALALPALRQSSELRPAALERPAFSG